MVSPTTSVDYEKEEAMGEHPPLESFSDPFNDDTPIDAQCDLSNPDVCDSCQ